MGSKGYKTMSKEELLKPIYVDKERQRDGAFIDHLSCSVIMKHTCRNYTIYDDVHVCTDCGDTKGIIG